jgi:hypothetical protein
MGRIRQTGTGTGCCKEFARFMAKQQPDTVRKKPPLVKKMFQPNDRFHPKFPLVNQVAGCMLCALL